LKSLLDDGDDDDALIEYMAKFGLFGGKTGRGARDKARRLLDE
jgi:hypothetical protein